MDALERLSLLSSHMDLEPAEDSEIRRHVKPAPASACGGSTNPPSSRKIKDAYIGHAILPNGHRMTLLKSLLTSVCERNCYYCPFRAGRDMPRTTFQPDEYAQTFMMMHQAGMIEGAFISSGVAGGGVRTQDKILDTADILRNKLNYRGYLHLKIMPGAERDQVEKAMRLADRVSINLEAPNTARLAKLAPHKTFMEELFEPLKWIDEIRRKRPWSLGWDGRWPSSSTQFVVGGAGESDLELLSTTDYLYRNLRLKRVYFSGFHPIMDTPLENQPETPPLREHRLYQASFLLRDYGFSTEELPFTQDGSLPMDTDPKLAWAKDNLSECPVDLNRATKQELLRVPGIGPTSAGRILDLRRHGQMLQAGDLENLRQLGANPRRAAPFILVGGKRPTYQMRLW